MAAKAAALCLGAAFAAIGYALFQTHQKLQNATREAAFLAQVLKQNDCPVDAIWRLDFRTQSLTGGPQFTPLIGKTLQFSDVASDLFSAGEHERDLVAGAFAPCRGPARYLFITHSAPVGDGRHVRLVHRAILQTGAMGRPLSLACVTSLAPVQSAQLPLNEQWKALRAHYGAAVEETRLDGQAPAPPSQALRARA
jgi:hypothetical protein